MENTFDSFEVNERKARNYQKFDVFRGSVGEDGVVQKIKSLGHAVIAEGTKTYSLYIKTLLSEVYYLLPEQKNESFADFVILTREESRIPGKKFFWNNVGEGVIFEDPSGKEYVQLQWDLFQGTHIFMNLETFSKSNRAS